MILNLRAGLAALLPDLIPEGSALSIAKVQTTRALYLVFSKGQAFPLCVVQFGTENDLHSLHCVLNDLHAALPDTVPRSLTCTRWDGDLWIHVQSGLRGFPWFAMPRRLRTLGQWLHLRTRALATLREFQAAVRADPRWSSTTSVSSELLRQLEICRRNNYGLSTAVIARATECAGRAKALSSGRYPWQHGDFCFNNLVVSPERLGLIDFEEFGSTAVPLHDELSLAFSAHDFMGGLPGAPPLHAQVRACTRDACDKHVTIPTPALEALLYHHLTWRLNQCLTRKRRAATAEALLVHLEHLASSPESYVREPD